MSRTTVCLPSTTSTRSRCASLPSTPKLLRRKVLAAKALDTGGTCSQWLKHVSLFYMRSGALQNVPVNFVSQTEGQIVFTFPGTMHAGFSTTYTCAEAVNYADIAGGWDLTKYRDCTTTCHHGAGLPPNSAWFRQRRASEQAMSAQQYAELERKQGPRQTDMSEDPNMGKASPPPSSLSSPQSLISLAMGGSRGKRRILSTNETSAGNQPAAKRPRKGPRTAESATTAGCPRPSSGCASLSAHRGRTGGTFGLGCRSGRHPCRQTHLPPLLATVAAGMPTSKSRRSSMLEIFLSRVYKAYLAESLDERRSPYQKFAIRGEKDKLTEEMGWEVTRQIQKKMEKILAKMPSESTSSQSLNHGRGEREDMWIGSSPELCRNLSSS